MIVDNWLSPGPHHKKLELVRSHYDLSFHCLGMNLAGQGPINWPYLKKVQELAQKFQPIHISDHLCFVAHKGSYHHDLLPFPLNGEFLAHIVARVRAIQEFLGRNILIENLSYYLEFESSEMSEGEFFRELTQRADSLILLDLNNLWVNEQNLGITMESFLNSLDLSKVQEVHLAGAQCMGPMYVDTHGGPIHKDLMKFLPRFPRFKDVPIIYERDTNLPGLEGMLSEVQKLHEL